MQKFNSQELQNLRIAFSVFDKNHDGTINRNELRSVLQELGIKPDEQILNQIIQNVDLDGDNLISFEEFVKMMAQKFNQPQSQIQYIEVFKIIDQDCDGKISKKELLNVIEAFDIKLNQNELDLMFDEAQEQGGKIYYDEYLRIMKCK